MDLADRLDRLEERVAALESGPPPARAPGTGPLWALEALKVRVGEPGAVLFTGSVTLPGPRHYDWQQGSEIGQLLDSDWAVAADHLGALGHPVRLALLKAVLGGMTTAAELAETAGLGTSGQLYHHLRHLVAVGWLRSTGRGQYEVPAGRVVALLVVITAGLS
ncbi:MAG: ArsR/SmtB family transcription factor [Pseudonocardiaceae bacterium]